jgi:hypothetical protein
MRIMRIPIKSVFDMKSKILPFLGAFLVSAGAIASARTARATIVDLTTGPDASGEIDGALFFATAQGATGTGVFQPFLRIDENSDFIQGYNTDGGFPFDDKKPHNFQHSLLISELTGTLIDGVAYYVFELDSNQSGGSFTQHEIDMVKLQIFTSNDPNQTTTTFDSNGVLQLNGTLVYNLDAKGDNTVKATALGSGKANFFMYIPVGMLGTGEEYLYLYSAFGNSIPSQGGFEEWIFIPGVLPIPETETFYPVIGLLVAVLSTRVLRRRKVAQLARQQVFFG